MNTRRARVLVIDDLQEIHEDFRRVLLKRPAEHGLNDLAAILFEEDPASSPKAALDCDLNFASQGQEGFEVFCETLETDPFDVVFVDMRMPPGWDGLRTIKEIFAIKPDQMVVLCTAYSDHSHEEIVSTIGTRSRFFILRKPFHSEELKQLVISATYYDSDNVRADKQQARELTTAIKEGEIKIEFQPIVQASLRSVYGFESLCRWIRPCGTSVSPADFIRVAEEQGAIRTLGTWIAERAVGSAQTINVGTPETSKLVTINISATQLQESFAEKMVRLCENVSLDPSFIGFELTEMAVMQDFEVNCRVLQELMLAGFTVLVDDFGSGVSNLSRITSIPFHVLKLDGAFGTDLHTNHRNQTVVRSMVSMTNDLGRILLAEGIESESDFEVLQELGCELAQGYYISRSMSLERATSFAMPESHRQSKSA